MTHTTAHLSVSLDGYVAGPDQSVDQPLGRGGLALHAWHLPGTEHDEVDLRWSERLLRPRGAYVMGRNMYGPVRGSWDSWESDWRGWWGDEPPYHAPVFVLTHHAHDPVEMAGGTTFHFVTGGVEDALRLARDAGDGDVHVAGGAATVRQVIALGDLDELSLDIAPVVLGAGERLFDGSVQPTLELLEAEHSPLATHVRYAVS